ncbi:pentapeptide repeat-containing protein [bacterium]|nr:pentapeptide repeat-containing protein [bacterium]
MNKEKKEEIKLNVCPIVDCGRPTHKKSEYCIFHARPEEKKEEEFKKAIKEYIEKIKENNLDYNFKRFIFIGKINFEKEFKVNTFKNANFWNAVFKGDADFIEATFEGDATNFIDITFDGNACFERAVFKGDAGFIEATFEGTANFIDVTFEGNACFERAVFKGDADFIEATFKGAIFNDNADFGGTVFKGDVLFTGVIFKGTAYFWEETFEGDADFSNTVFESDPIFQGRTFKRKASFMNATFKGDIGFMGATFKGNAYFSYATFSPGMELNLEVKNEGIISFEHTFLENVFLDLDLDNKVLIDFNDVLLRNTKIKKKQIENHILQEKKEEFSKASEIYLSLKNNFHSISRYEDESWAFKKEKDMERKNYFHFRTLHKWLWSCFLNGIFGYGEQPGKVIISAISIILIFTFLFMSSGISDTSIGGLSSKNFLDCIYFSTVTFTTLGYGDFRPLEGWGRIFAGTEAFIGALMMALFVYTFARRTGGR